MEYGTWVYNGNGQPGAKFAMAIHDVVDDQFDIANGPSASGNYVIADGSKLNILNFNDGPHAFGGLWVVATPVSNGSFTWYLDGHELVKQEWAYVDCATVPLFSQKLSPPTQYVPYAIADCMNHQMWLVSGPTIPITMYNVSVWQT
jgi:hypothetical protein